MRWREPLDEILGSRAKVRALRCLWAADGEALSGREVARRVGLSHTGTLKALDELAAQDVVWPSVDPAGERFRLNRTNALVHDTLMPMFVLESTLLQQTVSYLREAVPEAVSIVAFGSVARGDDGADSDLDVLVIVPDDCDSYAAGDRVDAVEHYARYGKLLQAIVWTRKELRAAHRRGLPLLAAILDEGVSLWGAPLRELLGKDKQRVAI